MYREHFRFTHMPFTNTPDPRFFFMTAGHEEALAALRYGVVEKRGFTAITGVPGCGKTLLGQMLVMSLEAHADSAVLSHTPDSPHDLLTTLCRDFGVRFRQSHSTGELINRLRGGLITRRHDERYAVALIDEAQNLSVELLEHVRMLGNMELDTAKLLQIVLLGQPELTELLRDARLLQLRQRIFCWRAIEPLGPGETRDYLRHRLKVAESPDLDLFADDAVETIHAQSHGVPRMINQIADNSLLVAYSNGQTRVNRGIVTDAVQQMMGLQTTSSRPAEPSCSWQKGTGTSRGVVFGIGNAETLGASPLLPQAHSASPPRQPAESTPADRDETRQKDARETARARRALRAARAGVEEARAACAATAAAGAQQTEALRDLLAGAAVTTERLAAAEALAAKTAKTVEVNRRAMEEAADRAIERLDGKRSAASAAEAALATTTERAAVVQRACETASEDAMGAVERVTRAGEDLSALLAELQRAGVATGQRCDELRALGGQLQDERKRGDEARTALAKDLEHGAEVLAERETRVMSLTRELDELRSSAAKQGEALVGACRSAGHAAARLEHSGDTARTAEADLLAATERALAARDRCQAAATDAAGQRDHLSQLVAEAPRRAALLAEEGARAANLGHELEHLLRLATDAVQTLAAGTACLASITRKCQDAEALGAALEDANTSARQSLESMAARGLEVQEAIDRFTASAATLSELCGTAKTVSESLNAAAAEAASADARLRATTAEVQDTLATARRVGGDLNNGIKTFATHAAGLEAQFAATIQLVEEAQSKADERCAALAAVEARAADTQSHLDERLASVERLAADLAGREQQLASREQEVGALLHSGGQMLEALAERERCVKEAADRLLALRGAIADDHAKLAREAAWARRADEALQRTARETLDQAADVVLALSRQVGRAQKVTLAAAAEAGDAREATVLLRKFAEEIDGLRAELWVRRDGTHPEEAAAAKPHQRRSSVDCSPPPLPSQTP